MNNRIQELQSAVGMKTSLLKDAKERVDDLHSALQRDERALENAWMEWFEVKRHERVRITKRYVDAHPEYNFAMGRIGSVYSASEKGVTLIIGGVGLPVTMDELHWLENVEAV